MPKPHLANRIKNLPPYLFAAIDQLKQKALAKGTDLINLGIGDPDLPTPVSIIQRLQRASEDPKNHQYPSYEGLLTFRQAAADWYQRRFGVRLDPKNEVLTLIGSKEGIGHAPLAFINPGDVALIPDPGYPVYHAGTLFAGGRSHFMPLRKENHFLPDFGRIPKAILKKARVLFINYPNNPTSATAGKEFFKEAIRLARRHKLIVCHDNAYSEVYFDGERPMSFLELDGAKEVGIEFHSLSKTFNMTGWRIGFAVGHPGILAALGKVKSNLDSGVFQAVQEAGIEALNLREAITDEIRKVYQERRDTLVSGLLGLGLSVDPPKATFYVWVGVPKGFTAMKFTMHLLDRAGIVTTPGSGFGKSGQGYIRMALTVPNDRLMEAVGRMERLLS
ncbi:MAG TPA: LL-diaminopimelate aminotransferase [Nitrospiria bacterium]|jgi:LL-diaminopimelate aminotransferase|nr:LL-diaminopimelate aminotransferase [Nitrospiria bacterium]